jgi:pimeloyl-ACP methyl ester carboxylesterase
MAYYTRGQGEPLLMINGFLSTMSLWDPLMLDERAKDHQLILFDNRGGALSTDTPQNHTTIQQMADDAAGLARSLGTSKVNVLADSMGARPCSAPPMWRAGGTIPARPRRPPWWPAPSPTTSGSPARRSSGRTGPAPCSGAATTATSRPSPPSGFRFWSPTAAPTPIDPPRNSLLIASQIPFSWLAFFEGGHAFVFQSYQQFADTVNVFLRG